MPKKAIPESATSLPKQEKFFSTEKLRRSSRTGTQLPDPTQAPYGFDSKAQYRHLFPELHLPALHPPASKHPEDTISFGSPKLAPNQLYLGDNLYVLRQLPSESIDLIYIDPPFFSNRTYTQIWGDDNEVRSFDDIFQDGMYSYLAWLNARLWEMKRVLKNTGSIYVHCDWHASHYIKVEMDKIFGYDNLLNEIIWCYRQGGRASEAFGNKHDILLWYKKTADHVFNADLIRIPYEGTGGYQTSGKGVTIKGKQYKPNELGKIPEDWWDIPALPPMSSERLGYPTQKPIELIQRVIEVACPPGGVVADLFMGGGTTGAVALGRRAYRSKRVVKKRSGDVEEVEELILKNDGKPRCFLGCDISRVAVSVSASRLIDLGEELSGVTVKEKEQKSLDFKTEDVADIHIHYVGSYPTEKFAGMNQEEFSKFILELYEAQSFTGTAKHLHGIANGKIIISVGPSDPNTRVTLAQVKSALEDMLRQYQTQLAEGEERILQVIGWSFDATVEPWKGKAINMLNKKGLKVQIDLISLSSETFRQKIFRHIGESNLDLKFNRLNKLLSFSSSPYPGKIRVVKQEGLKLTLKLDGAKPVGTGRLINCQWDMSYDGNRFADRAHALNRKKVGQGDFEAELTVEHTFGAAGTYNIAARVQDNLDGEATVVTRLILEKNKNSLFDPT